MFAVRRRALVPVALAGVGLALSACGGSATATATMPGSTGGTDGGSSSKPSSSSSTKLDPTAPVTRGDEKAATITPPGTKLKIGEAATLMAESGKKGDSYYTKAIYKVTVTDIRQGANADFASFKNKEEFAGVTPWYIESTNEIVYWEGNQYGSPSVTLSGVRADGSKAGWVSAFGNFDKCKSTSFKTREVGDKAKPCTIAATTGAAVTGARYEGDSSSDYYKAPVVWSK